MLIGDREVVCGMTSVPTKMVYDMSLFYEGDDLDELAARLLPPSELRTYRVDRARLKAILRSAKVAKVDPLAPVDHLVPRDLLERHEAARQDVIGVAWVGVLGRGAEALQTYEEETFPYAVALLRMGQNGVKIDRERCMELLRDESSLAVGKHVLRSMLDFSKIDGFARTRYTMFGGKTGRIGIESGFETMTIPHGRCRSCVRSRFKDGKIYAIDFNAIDFRSIVKNVPEVSPLYESCRDFHTRTRELLGMTEDDVSREALKHLTYVYLYGGSMDTIQRQTKLSVARIEEILKVFDGRFKPLHEFRRALHAKAIVDGHVTMPNGKKVPVAPDDHAGKVLGLYAQTYSSWIFQRALIRADRYIEEQRRVNGLWMTTCFPVHDELVIDAPEHELPAVAWLADVIEDHTGFKVKVNHGDDYSQATD